MAVHSRSSRIILRRRPLPPKIITCLIVHNLRNIHFSFVNLNCILYNKLEGESCIVQYFSHEKIIITKKSVEQIKLWYGMFYPV